MTKEEIINTVRKRRVKTLFILLGSTLFAIVFELLSIVLFYYLEIDKETIKYYVYLLGFSISLQIIMMLYLYKKNRKTRIDISDDDILKSYEARDLIIKYGLKEQDEINID